MLTPTLTLTLFLCQPGIDAEFTLHGRASIESLLEQLEDDSSCEPTQDFKFKWRACSM